MAVVMAEEFFVQELLERIVELEEILVFFNKIYLVLSNSLRKIAERGRNSVILHHFQVSRLHIHHVVRSQNQKMLLLPQLIFRMQSLAHSDKLSDHAITCFVTFEGPVDYFGVLEEAGK